jgi:WD40 repeat protein
MYDHSNSYNQKIEFNKNKWDCLTTFDAHATPVLAIENYKNYLISTATRNVRIWDLETNKLESDITGPSLPSFVKNVIVHQDRQLMATACDKNITLWDLRTLNT